MTIAADRTLHNKRGHGPDMDQAMPDASGGPLFTSASRPERFSGPGMPATPECV